MSCAGNTRGDCYAAVWAQRVVNNGGSRPSQATIDAAAAFHNTLRTAGLLTKIKALNFFAPDSLTAALVPFIKGTGNDIWTNTGPFVAGDLTVNGLKGDGSSKFLKTGVSTNVLSAGSAGAACYMSEIPIANSCMIGGRTNSSNALQLQPYAGTMYWDCWDETSARISAPMGFAGYYSGNRVAVNDTQLFAANGVNAHAQIAASNANSGGNPNIEIYVFALNNNGAATSAAPQRVSFISIHAGLTQAEDLAFYNAVVALRTALGGGYV